MGFNVEDQVNVDADLLHYPQLISNLLLYLGNNYQNVHKLQFCSYGQRLTSLGLMEDIAFIDESVVLYVISKLTRLKSHSMDILPTITTRIMDI